MDIDVLLIGHITKDMMPDGSLVPGGAVHYCSVALSRLGLRAAVVTSARVDDDDLFADREHWSCKPAKRTTIFRNVVTPSGRQQYLLARASSITAKDIPDHWRRFPSVIICPVAQEVSPAMAQAFPSSLVMLVPQGLTRAWNEHGVVFRPHGGLNGATNGTTIAVMSREDIGKNQAVITELSNGPEIAVITDGARGCTVRQGKETRHIPAFPAREVDSTGAGDVFAAAFLFAYRRNADAFKAARFAGIAAAISIESAGITGIPTLDDIRAKEDSSDVQ